MANQPTAAPLEGTVAVVGSRPKVSFASRDAAVADLSVTLTGGTGRAPVLLTISLGLNTPVTGRAQLTDAATNQVLAESTRSGSGYVFRNVPVTPPGARARRFRITNIRANASQLASGPASTTPVQIVAFLSITGPFRIPLSGSQQNVAAIER